MDHDVTVTAVCIREVDILEQFQTHHAELEKDDNDCGNETVKNVAP